MPTTECPRAAAAAGRVLFIQATEPAGYPPLIHAASLMAEAGWEITFLSAPIAGKQLELPCHPRIRVRTIAPRRSHVMDKPAYGVYLAAAARLAVQWRPTVVYASDPLGAGPGLLAARLARAHLVYHEHDSPSPGMLRPWLARLRAAAARRAELVVFPNEARARIAQAEIGFADERLRVVWNMPLLAELPALAAPPCATPLIVYYHGSITPERLPETVVEALRRLHGRVRLLIVGYEAPGASGYVRRLVESGNGGADGPLVEHQGAMPRGGLIAAAAAQAHIGLALMPRNGGGDPNLRHMTGASNKAFDYLAAGLALLVSDLADWRALYVAPGYGLACDPADPESIASALRWFLDHPAERAAMSARGRARIEREWNYDAAFAPVLTALCDG